MKFKDRTEAGRRLAERLLRYAPDKPVVLAVPRGGVPVAYEIARRLEAPLDIIVVRKLGVPTQPELAMGAVGPGGAMVLDRATMETAGVSARELTAIVERERAEVARRLREYRQGLVPLDLANRLAILVDDGIATGSSIMAAIEVLRHMGPEKIVLAAPVVPADRVRLLRELADDFVFLATPEPFLAIGVWYEDFQQVTDGQVKDLLFKARRQQSAPEVST